MTRHALAVSMFFTILISPAMAERETAQLSGGGPFSITRRDSAMVFDENNENAKIEVTYNDPLGLVRWVGIGTVFRNGQYEKDTATVNIRAGISVSGTIEIKFITKSRMGNVQVKTRAVRVTVQ